MTLLEPESGSVIPAEWQGYCDIYLEKLRSRLPEQTSQKGSGALQRAINYFVGNPDALLREVQTQFELRPSYFGIEEQKASSEIVTTPATDLATDESSSGRKRQKGVGPEEAAIIDEIEARFASEELLNAIKTGRRIKGTKT